MKVLRLFFVSLLLILGVTGCASNTSLQKEVIQHNQQVSMLLSSYHQSVKSGERLAPTLFSAILTGDTQVLASNAYFQNINFSLSTLNGGVSGLHAALVAYINDHNTSIKLALPSQRGEQSLLTLTPSFLRKVLHTNYFLNSSNGEVEQFDLLELPDGFTGFLVVVWLGGDVINVKASLGN